MPPPPPKNVFRYHSHPVHSASFSTDNKLLYAGDEDGWVSITDLMSMRVVAHWKAHDAGVLAVSDWQGGLVSHGRDNIIHFHEPLNRASASAAPALNPSAPQSSSRSLVSTTTTYRTLLAPPPIIRSLPVNSLNFCGFDLVPIPTGYELDVPAVDDLEEEDEKAQEDGKLNGVDGDHGKFVGIWKSKQGLLAVPNLTDSETIDIYHVPSFGRLHAAVTSGPKPANPETEGKIRSGLVMSLRLYFTPSASEPTSPIDDPQSNHVANQISLHSNPKSLRLALRLVAAFEDGRVEQWENQNWQKRTDPRMRVVGDSARTQEMGWRKLWSQKGHNEAIMAMTVSPTFDYAYTVSADHQVVKYDLQVGCLLAGFGITLTGPGFPAQAGEKSGQGTQQNPEPTRFATKQIGNSAIAVSPDGKVVAVGGWDGSVRLYSAKTFKSLGTLAYHRQTCHTIAFPHSPSVKQPESLNLDSRIGTEDEASVIKVVDEDEGDSSEDEEGGGSGGRAGKGDVLRWMVSGGKDRRLALWRLKDFSRR